ncbi:hypothetical protein [Streptomyces sp. NPDC048282]|uniref:hypothetical protein n=1 Tax=Streptomyces sp. NPDC048282 TaxID=3365528 RepID=UPI003722E010
MIRALPHAAVAFDCFHILQPAQRHPADLRHRLTWKQHGRRARKVTVSTPSASSCARQRGPHRRRTHSPQDRAGVQGLHGHLRPCPTW